MSLYVVVKSLNEQGKQNAIERHIPFAPARIPTLENEVIDFIQADGDELVAIREMFTVPITDTINQLTIPFPNKRVVRWYGDLARTIYQNLRYQ